MFRIRSVAFILALLALAWGLCSCVSVEQPQTDVNNETTVGNTAETYDYDYASLSLVDEYQRTLQMCTDLKKQDYAKYKGKTVRMKGEYMTSDPYHFLVIFLDDTRCCFNDFELLYGGSYPAVGTSVEITGRIDSYTAPDGTWPCIVVDTMKTL